MLLHVKHPPAIVLGLWWGDEGKGRVVDWLASKESSMVVRFNGGPQSGHTVVRGDITHVFSHFGAGSLVGAPTFLASPFVCNPMIFSRETEELSAQGLHRPPTLIVDPDCRVTIPLDVAICQEAENARRGSCYPHGSCGLGVNETARRDFVFPIRVRDLFCGAGALRSRLCTINKHWGPRRCEFLGCAGITNRALERADGVLAEWLQAAEEFIDSITIHDQSILVETGRRIIFEGGQGLQLSESKIQSWPHVTPSRTGVDNAIPILKGIYARAAEIFFVSRAYTTRHGPGPFPTELPGISYPDSTNVPNQWQGTARFGAIDFREIRQSVLEETGKLESAGIQATRRGVITCLDQAGEFQAMGAGAVMGVLENLPRDSIVAAFGESIYYNHGFQGSCIPPILPNGSIFVSESSSGDIRPA